MSEYARGGARATRLDKEVEEQIREQFDTVDNIGPVDAASGLAWAAEFVLEVSNTPEVERSLDGLYVALALYQKVEALEDERRRANPGPPSFWLAGKPG
jgi:hypothetical protein